MVTKSSHTHNTKQIKIFTGNKESYFEKEIHHISITPAGENSKKLIGHVIVLRNVTEYKELDYAKTNFISTVSHEFKTPISSMKMSLQLLQNKEIGTLNNEQLSLVDSINDDAGRLLKITSELLNISQVESGNIQINRLPIDPNEILNDALFSTQTQADSKNIKFAIDCQKNIPKILADREKTSWVLNNLITNAIRYSHENSVVYLKMFELNSNVNISVRDKGQGIEQQYLDKIFNRYFRVPGNKIEGTGLGLSICKAFIEAQNGSIYVESEYGSGSTFVISLQAVN